MKFYKTRDFLSSLSLLETFSKLVNQEEEEEEEDEEEEEEEEEGEMSETKF